MILRHVTEHVKAQNWFAVGLDFVIVVTGVFIGLQVANWNAVRRAEQELGVIQRLQSFQTEAYLLERVAVRNVLVALEGTE